MAKTYTSRLQKGGGLVDEMRALVRVWDYDRPQAEIVNDLIQTNVLGKASRSRMEDMIYYMFVPRYVKSEPKDIWRYLNKLEELNVPTKTINNIVYYHSAKGDDLLYDFVTEYLFEKYSMADFNLNSYDAVKFITDAEGTERLPQGWSEAVKIRVARGLLAALKDYGILEGKAKKKIAPVFLPIEAFVYIAFFLYKNFGITGEKLLNHQDWRLFFFNGIIVERMFLEAHQHGYLQYNVAGSVVRVDFDYQDMEEVCHAITRKAN